MLLFGLISSPPPRVMETADDAGRQEDWVVEGEEEDVGWMLDVSNIYISMVHIYILNCLHTQMQNKP